MSDEEYFQVHSFKFPNNSEPYLVLSGTNGNKDLAMYIDEEENVPDYIQEHKDRNIEADQVNINMILHRLTENHMNEEVEED